MKEEHEQCLVGDQQAFRTYTSRFRIFNANRYLQTGNAVSPVLSAAIGALLGLWPPASVVDMCSHLRHQADSSTVLVSGDLPGIYHCSCSRVETISFKPSAAVASSSTRCPAVLCLHRSLTVDTPHRNSARVS